MKNSTVRFVLALLTLIVGAALEELLPKALGVGFPILLVSVAWFAPHDPLPLPVLFAVLAGLFEDSLSHLTLLTSVSFFLSLVLLVRLVGLHRLLAFLVFPAYEFWLWLWVRDLQGGLFTRLLISLPFGLLTAFAVTVLLEKLEERVAADEAD